MEDFDLDDDEGHDDDDVAAAGGGDDGDTRSPRSPTDASNGHSHKRGGDTQHLSAEDKKKAYEVSNGDM